MKNCWLSPTDFPLHSALMGATPFVDEQGFRSYEGKKIPGVEIHKLAYFGASIFWRAAVRSWMVGKEKDARLPLGPYQEALGLYLFLYMSEDRDSDLLKTMAVMATRAEKKGKLRKEPQAG